MAPRNKFYYMALARKKREPREMVARYDGICSACHGPIKPGDPIVYLGTTRDVWHVNCYRAAETEPTTTTPSAPAEPEPAAATQEPAEPYNPMDLATWKQEQATHLSGTCQHCKRFIQAREIFLRQERYQWTVHGSCWFDYQRQIADAMKQPDPTPAQAVEPMPATVTEQAEPEPQPEPEPEQEQEQPEITGPAAPGIVKVSLESGNASVLAWTDSLIKDDEGNARFFSLLGTDSTIKACSGYFLDGKAKYYGDGLWTLDDRNRPDNTIRRDTAGTYRVLSSKLDRGAQQIVCDERFLPGHSLEKEFRYLLINPGQDPGTELFEFVKREIPTPMLPDWQTAIVDNLFKNWKRHEHDKTALECKARARRIKPVIGERSAIQLRITEETLDALVSRLVRAGSIDF